MYCYSIIMFSVKKDYQSRYRTWISIGINAVLSSYAIFAVERANVEDHLSYVNSLWLVDSFLFVLFIKRFSYRFTATFIPGVWHASRWSVPGIVCPTGPIINSIICWVSRRCYYCLYFSWKYKSHHKMFNCKWFVKLEI